LRPQGDHVLLLLLLELLVLVHMALQLQDSCLVTAGCLLQAASTQTQADQHSAGMLTAAAVVVVCTVNCAAFKVNSSTALLLQTVHGCYNSAAFD
jgi:hypothetical protein